MNKRLNTNLTKIQSMNSKSAQERTAKKNDSL